MSIVAKSSGDAGDIVYSLPTIRALGGGKLYLDVYGGETSPHVRHMTDVFGRHRLKFDQKMFDFLKPLLDVQPYLQGVEVWNPDIQITHDFDEPRSNWPGGVPIAYVYANHFKVLVAARERWLFVPKQEKKYDLVVARSLRYHGNHGFWELQAPYSHDHRCAFVGTPLEYQVFTTVFPEWNVEHVICSTALDLAITIAQGESFVGNQSLPMAIAIGLGKEFVQEVYQRNPNCVYEWGRYV